MAFKDKEDFSYDIDKDFDYTIEEKDNSFVALRKIRWGNREDYRLDLRKYISTEEGERMGKGLSFLTEDGPSELVKVLLDNDYGKPDEISDTIVNNRRDIFEAISKKVNGNFPSIDNDGEDEDLFDARRLFDE